VRVLHNMFWMINVILACKLHFIQSPLNFAACHMYRDEKFNQANMLLAAGNLYEQQAEDLTANLGYFCFSGRTRYQVNAAGGYSQHECQRSEDANTHTHKLTYIQTSKHTHIHQETHVYTYTHIQTHTHTWNFAVARMMEGGFRPEGLPSK